MPKWDVAANEIFVQALEVESAEMRLSPDEDPTLDLRAAVLSVPASLAGRALLFRSFGGSFLPP